MGVLQATLVQLLQRRLLSGSRSLASILAYWQLACVRFESSHAAAAEGGASNQILLSEYFYEEACSVFGINMN